jgi:hypothetical protein
VEVKELCLESEDVTSLFFEAAEEVEKESGGQEEKEEEKEKEKDHESNLSKAVIGQSCSVLLLRSV